MMKLFIFVSEKLAKHDLEQTQQLLNIKKVTKKI